MTTVIVSGPLANKRGNAGGAWERMSWVVGLARLGCDVWFVEQIAPDACVDAAGRPTNVLTSVNLEWFRATTEWFGVADRSVLVINSDEPFGGVRWPQLLKIADSADLLVNLSGHLTIPELLQRIRRKVYVDVDPGFTQFWHVDPNMPFSVEGHDLYYTIGENIGSPNCEIPTGDISWRPIRQPVVLDQWPVVTGGSADCFTTIASWRGPFGPVTTIGRTFGLKVHEFRKFLEVPQRVGATFEIALDIHPSDQKDRDALERHGWRIVDPGAVAPHPASFRRYIQQSAAEFSVAQGIYVETNSGWFSDRSVRYLASGRPVLVQDTGFGRQLPVGRGLLSFRTVDEAVAGAREILSGYADHCRAARALAENYFDSDHVLGRFLSDAGVRA